MCATGHNNLPYLQVTREGLPRRNACGPIASFNSDGKRSSKGARFQRAAVPLVYKYLKKDK